MRVQRFDELKQLDVEKLKRRQEDTLAEFPRSCETEDATQHGCVVRNCVRRTRESPTLFDKSSFNGFLNSVIVILFN